ncbi:MAG: FAD-binding oxidoreductase [Pseudomonadota bacterium]
MDADFLIIGGGIAGVSAAARLSHLGKVILLEAEQSVGWHASGRSAALFEETYGKNSTITLNRASRDYHMTANGGVLSPRGLMLLGGQDATTFEAERDGMQMRELTLDEALAHVPILDPAAFVRAGYRAEVWDIDTDLLMQNFVRETRSNAGDIVTNAGATSIAFQSGLWSVTTSLAQYTGRVLINAAGAWADRIAEMAGVPPLGIQPYRRSMARIAAPGGHDTRSWPMMFGTGESWYAKPDAGALLVSPADEDPMHPHDAWADDMVLAEGFARYEACMQIKVTRPIATWAGLRSFAPDRELVIGFANDHSGFFWLAGQGGYGMQTSPAASRLAADLIGGTTPEIDPASVTALSPARFTSS